ncbi:MAG: multiheme c-type cytochrome [Bryobacteraceae bacterium]|nr:multiheme c-type cytochrome [Bryobacteraceae bacterium]
MRLRASTGRLVAAGMVLAAGLAVSVVYPRAAVRPVYIGARACAQCHEGAEMGRQYAKWLTTKHAKAWATLAMPESAEISRISGLREPPQKSPVCLGCHAVASDTENWERDDTFHIEDGIQCEACHGPGSEYANRQTMLDKKAAMMAGLRMPTERVCMVCHIEKGSHTAVLKSEKFDFNKAMAQIAHPRSGVGSNTGGPPEPKLVEGTGKGPKLIGALACGKCHEPAGKGAQYSVWRMSPHARAWGTLSSAKGREMARAEGVMGEPGESPKCLACHAPGAQMAAADSYIPDEGVGCEACHGPGSDYAPEAIMKDRTAAMAAGLRMPKLEGCNHCHANAHGKAFDAKAAFAKIAHPAKTTQPYAQPRYLNPLRLWERPGAHELFVTFEAAGSVGVVDMATRKKVAEIPTGTAPTGIAFSPDGRFAYVTNREDDTVAVINAAARKVIRTVKTGGEPHGLLTDKDGRRLYVANTMSGDIYVYNTGNWERERVLSASRGPWSMALSPDGGSLLVSNTYSRFTEFRKPRVAEVTEIETDRSAVGNRVVVPGANLMMGIAWHPSGEYALTVLNRTKNLVPMTQLTQGWTITNGLAIVWKDGTVDEVLLDEPNLGFADATDVTFTPDGRHALMTSSGTNRIAIVDTAKLIAVVKRATPEERAKVLPNHLGKSTEFVQGYLKTGASPRGVVVSADGKWAYVTNSLDDTLSVFDLTKMQSAGVIDLGGPKEVTLTRRGERVFHSADVTFRKQFACHSCHPDGHVDGLTYDVESIGIGISPVDNRTLRGILDTAPFKWAGTNPTLSRQCGPRLSVFFTRLLPFTAEDLKALDHYVTTIQRPPNRYRALWAPLTAAQRRGKEVFERTRTTDGREIPEDGRCITCHPAPYYTDRQLHDVGTKQSFDKEDKLDVPHLKNIYDSAPYLHNGMAHTLEEIWTVYNPYDKHGVTNDLTKDQLNDLIEYLKTL